MTNIAIFASGRGTNAEAIINHFRGSGDVSVALVVSNNADADVTRIAKRHGIPVEVIAKSAFEHPRKLLDVLKEHRIGFIVLAGFLWLIPDYLLSAFPNRIVNIHPALLPKYGGKGMYGSRVHEAVVRARDKETGITVHYVNERFDEGEIIFQARCPVEPTDDAASLRAKVQRLEHQYYPKVIEKLLIKETVS